MKDLYKKLKNILAMFLITIAITNSINSARAGAWINIRRDAARHPVAAIGVLSGIIGSAIKITIDAINSYLDRWERIRYHEEKLRTLREQKDDVGKIENADAQSKNHNKDGEL
jgi:hypothetical protein